MEAPVNGPPKNAHTATVEPMAIPASSPTALESVATEMITNIRQKVMSASTRNPAPMLVLTTVLPNPWTPEKIS